MSQRRLRALALLLVLPALLLRALIPAGFMPMAVAGSVHIALCPGVTDVATFIAAAHDPHAQHHHEAHRAPSCPYALGSGAAPQMASLPPPALAPLALQVLAQPVACLHSTSIVRAQCARGPPLPA